ncbi:nitrilase [Paraperlucidibaca baekdonensis]|uniref:Nitrilase n=1 Tax=Paraperlucidibaca baekdonensis TaxID=748120 RepID=A0A3E0H587_9GAMM|nr:nitrilase-related carbon-nitrogen hydrolase [Paraperlucidibaca baekdonensis]REH38713.1 nitrilase [Paraperlucidibaca baekdonensis]
MRVGALELCSSDDIAANQQAISYGICQAQSAGVELLVLPENCLVFGPDAVAQAALAHASWLAWLAAQARAAKIWLLAGTVPLPYRPDGTPVPNGRVRSASLLFSAWGECVGRYDKRHLFDAQVGDAQGAYRESARYEPGDEAELLLTPWGALGVLTCYDLRFPEQARVLRKAGAQLLVVPAAFTAATGAAHWQVLLRARAIENQCAVIGAAQGGQHSATRQTWGHSQIIDAWGQVLAIRDESGQPALVVADIDQQQQQQWRADMPVEAHRLD